MGIISTVLTNAISTQDKPVAAMALCINRKQHKIHCTACVDVCPGAVFGPNSRRPPKWDQCTSCGACITACPARCFTPGVQMRKNLSQNLQLNVPVSFACFSDRTPCTRRFECLAGIPWELAATLAMYTDVVFYVGACAHCEHAPQVNQIHDNLCALRDFLGNRLFASRIHILSEGQFEAPAQDSHAAVSRRELFSGAGKSARQTLAHTALGLLPASNEPQNGFAYREQLGDATARVYANYKKALAEYREAVAAQKEGTAVTEDGTGEAQEDVPRAPLQAPVQTTFGVSLPRFTKDCFGCTICSKACASKALEVSEEHSGKRTIYITPWKCTSCGACVRACPYHGISELQLLQVPHMNRLALVQVASSTCVDCGRAVKPDPEAEEPLCLSCKRKRDRKARIEARAARKAAQAERDKALAEAQIAKRTAEAEGAAAEGADAVLAEGAALAAAAGAQAEEAAPSAAPAEKIAASDTENAGSAETACDEAAPDQEEKDPAPAAADPGKEPEDATLSD